jgi:hypothetical protein
VEVEEEEALRMLDKDEMKTETENSDTHRIPTTITASVQPDSTPRICSSR